MTKNKYQKGIHPGNKRILVFRDCYGSSLSYLKELVAELKADFPNAKDTEIEFPEFDNAHRKGVICLAFNNTQNLTVPIDYQEFPIDWVRMRPL